MNRLAQNAIATNNLIFPFFDRGNLLILPFCHESNFYGASRCHWCHLSPSTNGTVFALKLTTKVSSSSLSHEHTVFSSLFVFRANASKRTNHSLCSSSHELAIQFYSVDFLVICSILSLLSSIVFDLLSSFTHI